MLKVAVAVVGGLAAAVWAVFFYTYAQSLRETGGYADVEEALGIFPHLLPLLGVVASALLVRKNRPGEALALALTTLLIVTFFWIVQGAARAG